jgi:hypothetical protein
MKILSKFEKMQYLYERKIISVGEFREYLKKHEGLTLSDFVIQPATNDNKKPMVDFRNPLKNYSKAVNADGLLSPQKPQPMKREVNSNE